VEGKVDEACSGREMWRDLILAISFHGCSARIYM